MSELLLKIYERVISYEDETVRMGYRVDEWVAEFIKPYHDNLNNDEMEKLRDLMYSIALKAEQEGFQLGLKIFVKLLIEILS